MHPGSSLVSVSINGTALTLSLLTAGLAAIRPLLLATIFSMGVVPNELTTIPLRNILAAWGMDGIIGVLTLLAALEAAAFFAGFFNDILVLLQAQRQGRIHRALIARRVLMAMSNRGQEQVVNSYISRVRADIDVIEQYHRTSLIPSFAALFQIAFSIVLAAMLSVLLAGILISEIAIIVFLVWIYSNLHVRLALDRLTAEERLSRGAQLYMRAAIAIWFGRIGALWFRHRLRDAKALAAARFRYGIGAAAYHNLVSFGLGLSVVVGGFLLLGGNVAGAKDQFFLLVLYSGFLLGPVIRLTSFVPETREYQTARARITGNERHEISRSRSIRRLEPCRIELSAAKEMSIRRQDDNASSSHFSFALGEKVAIIGQSGSGKTSMLEYILGARRPTESWAKVWGCRSHEIAHMMPFLGVAYLTDTAFFENGTIEQNNIGKSTESARLLKAVGLIEDEGAIAEFLSRPIDRNGEPLSLGERQRVQLVRTLLTPPKVLVMDEALSGIAQEAEARIVSWLISDELKDATVMYVSHRPAIQALFSTQICLN